MPLGSGKSPITRETNDKVYVIETYAKMDLFSEKMVGLGVGILEEIIWWFHC